MKIDKKLIIVSAILHLLIIITTNIDIKTNFGNLMLWLIPLYFLSLYCDNLINSFIVCIHSILISTRLINAEFGMTQSFFYAVVLAILIFMAYKFYAVLYRGDEVSKYVSVVAAVLFANIIVLFIGLISSNYHYIIDNILASIYSGLFAAILSYVYKSLSEQESKAGIKYEL